MNQRERKMLIMLGVVGFLGLNAILYSSYSEGMTKLGSEKTRLASDNEIKDKELSDGVEWNAAKERFDTSPVTVSTADDAQNVLLNTVKTAAENCSLLINSGQPIRFLPAIVGSPYSRVRVSISFTSSPSSFTQWVTQMNIPQKYQTITDLKVEPTADRKMLKVSAVVEQWIELPGQEGTTEEPLPDEEGTDEEDKTDDESPDSPSETPSDESEDVEPPAPEEDDSEPNPES